MKRPTLVLNRITLSLALVVIYLYTVPYIPAAEPYFAITTSALVVVLFAWALAKKAWQDVIISGMVAATFIIGRQIFNQVDAFSFIFRTSAVLAFWFLHLTLLVGPWARFTKYGQAIYKHRRHLGVTTFLLALTHAGLIMRLYFQYDITTAWSSTFVFFGTTALFVMGVLALTSWDYVQKYVAAKWWKIAHPALLVVFLGMVGMLYTLALDLQTWHWVFFALFVVYWLASAPWSLPQKVMRRVNGWKQIHVLVYIAYTSMIIHVWTGVASLQAPWVQALFWTLVIAVVTSHTIGWIMAAKRRKKAAGKTMMIDGAEFVAVGAASDFENGKGQKHIVAEKPVAVFKDGDNWFAMSSICPHQGGPINEGTIVNGYVECPWHKWQFSVSDGSGPPGFPDCIPYHEVRVQDNTVYVAVKDTEKCQEKDGHTHFTK